MLLLNKKKSHLSDGAHVHGVKFVHARILYTRDALWSKNVLFLFEQLQLGV